MAFSSGKILSWERFMRETTDLREAIAIAVATRRILNGEIHYPPDDKIYRAFEFNEPEEIKVILLAQDPYHGKNQANGLALSVDKGVPIPSSLRNIFKELHSDLGIKIPSHGDLTDWAKQGVLLLNSSLTVTKDQAASHAEVGWEDFTDKAIELLSKHGNKVFVLWGKWAQKKESLIDTTKNLVIKSPHPSGQTAHTGFFGSKPFSKTNEYLISVGKNPIDWNLENA